ncbi:MAG: hypothetical protein AAF645_14820 [Myxococcota bacterium]
MKWVRRHRSRIVAIFSFGALVAMTFGFLKRIGIDPLAPDRSEPVPVVADPECRSIDFEGLCEATQVTPLTGGSFRIEYELVDGPGSIRAVRTSGTVGERVRCSGTYLDGPCESAGFQFEAAQ